MTSSFFGTTCIILAGKASFKDATQAPTNLNVDDIHLNRRMLKAMLKTANYRILEAKRPSIALGMLEREKVDLVVVDLMMPEMSGPDFCRMLKKTGVRN